MKRQLCIDVAKVHDNDAEVSRRIPLIRRRLLAWYDRNKRDLPWRRRSDDPYAQWVAEVMLQQTRVPTVEGYYDRFLDRFPTVTALALAKHDDVLKLWEGLGYYRRALNLHGAARQLHETGQAIPRTSEGLRRLPGIGEYISAAVASIALNEPVAAVDGNVARVIARLFAIRDDVLSLAGKRKVTGWARKLLSRKRPGDFNQAWMDLGSLVCQPVAPKCHACPLRSHCAAAREGLQDQLPVRSRNRVVPTVSFVVGVFVRRGRTLVRKRPEGGLWSGLWELPCVEREENAATPRRNIAKRTPSHSSPENGEVRRLADSLGISLAEPPLDAGVITHRLTHRVMEFQTYVCSAEPAGANGERRNSHLASDGKWLHAGAIAELAMSVAHRRILTAARAAVEHNAVSAQP